MLRVAWTCAKGNLQVMTEAHPGVGPRTPPYRYG